MKKTIFLLLMGWALFSTSAYADGEKDKLPEIWGNLIYESEIANNPDVLRGIYRFTPTENSADTLKLGTIYVSTMMEANGGGVFRNGKFQFVNEIDPGDLYSSQQAFYECSINENNEVHWLPEDRYGVTVESLAAYSGCLTMDPRTGKLYGIYPEDYGYSNYLSTVDFDVLSRENIGEVNQYYLTLSINRQGEMYGIDDYGDLYKIDMNSGNETLVGATGVVPGNYYQSATFDQTTGKLWWAARTEGERSVLYEVNTSTGEATQKAVFPWDERFLALYIPDSLGIDSTKIGLDKPAAPTKATLDGNAEEIVLKWNASKGALHKDGKISDKGLTYHVTLHYGDGALNFDAQDTTKVFAIDDLDIAELTKCYFEVVTMNDSVASDTTTSNSFAAGQVLEVPYNNEFKSSEDFDQLTILDNNGDGRTWQFVEDYNTVIYKYADEDADDWILTPMLNLKGGQKYIFKFQASPQGSEYPETLNAAFGKTIDVESYTTILEKAVVATKDSVFEVTFTPDADGAYHVGLQIVSPSTQLNCILDNISVTTAEATIIKDISKKSTLSEDVEYNLLGQRTNSSYRGVVIRKGKKVMKK